MQKSLTRKKSIDNYREKRKELFCLLCVIRHLEKNLISIIEKCLILTKQSQKTSFDCVRDAFYHTKYFHLTKSFE